MNNTKWNEIFKAFYKNECEENSVLVRWRIKDLQTGYLSLFDGTWTHFGCEPRDWECIDYLQIELTEENSDFVLQTLHQIHVPGTVSEKMATVYGYNQNVNYI